MLAQVRGFLLRGTVEAVATLSCDPGLDLDPIPVILKQLTLKVAWPPRTPVLEWVERVSMYFARDGVPTIAGRMLGWLMVCDPSEQSAQISDAIGASRASREHEQKR